MRTRCAVVTGVQTCARPILAESYTGDEVHAGFTVYEAVGCDECTAGYKGRTGLYQVMPMTDEIATIVLEGGNAVQIAEAAQRSGLRDLRQSAVMKVKVGVTSLAEIQRGAQECFDALTFKGRVGRGWVCRPPARNGAVGRGDAPEHVAQS